jgi:hypothetical protein
VIGTPTSAATPSGTSIVTAWLIVPPPYVPLSRTTTSPPGKSCAIAPENVRQGVAGSLQMFASLPVTET